MKAKHCKKMAEYAEDAAYTDKPWELWECRNNNDTNWGKLYAHPNWYEHFTYRRKNLSGKQISEGWIPWSGGENPASDCQVEVMYRDGSTYPYSSAGGVRWKHIDAGGDIIAYKVLSDQYSKLKEALKDKNLKVCRKGIQVVDNHSFFGGCELYSIHKIEPLGKEDFYPGVFIRVKGSPNWLPVIGVNNSSIEVPTPAAPSGYWITFQSLVNDYEIWSPEDKTWNPCYKEVKIS